MYCGRVRRTIDWVTLGLLVVLYGACAASDVADEQAGEPEVSVEATAPLLAPGEIEILVDPMGIPHIYGGTDEDVFFGYGYQVASDRAFQLALFRRQALGRSAEVLGEPGLLRDRYARVFNWRDWGRLDAAWMAEHEPERYGLIEAYVAGINRRVTEIREGLVDRPFGFGP
ncbi:MAG: penicillin acylase family protein, partial [Myxococcota bacterium]|nr:penicillin acylase family protein [Myxococcota bacterium]